MSTRKGTCTNYGNCSLADRREEIADSGDFACPECQSALHEVGAAKKGFPVWLFAVLGVVVLGGLAAVAYLMLGQAEVPSPAATEAAPPPEPVSAPADPPPPIVAAAVDEGRGPCHLKPTPVADVARLLEYLKQGMNYASQKQYDLALAEYKQVLVIDPYFLGAHENVGSALIVLKRYEAAENQLKQELSSLACLEQMVDTDLVEFAYMIETGGPLLGDKTPVYRARLRETKATTHYNLACLYSLQNRKDDAVDALRAAVDSGFSNVHALKQDPDLRNIRATHGFQEIVASIH